MNNAYEQIKSSAEMVSEDSLVFFENNLEFPPGAISCNPVEIYNMPSSS